MEQGTSSLCHAGDEKYTRKIITFCKVSLRNSAFLGGTICGRTRKSFAVGERETQRLPKHIDTLGDTKGIFISLVCEFASQFASPFFLSGQKLVRNTALVLTGFAWIWLKQTTPRT